jgi:poly(A) polymerase
MTTEARLPHPAWLEAPPTRAVIAALEAEGGAGCARFVGGCVRDAWLDRTRPDQDIDIATSLTPDRVTVAIERAGLRAVATGIAHGTVTAVAAHQPFEITTLRRDVETDGRRAVVAFTEDWAEDAARRDFRLNALYAEPDGRLHDPTGGGLADARAGRIVFVGDPETRIREDYLRILRFFRFYAGYGQGAPDGRGLAACAALRDGLEQLSGERVARELLKLLAALDPGPSVQAMAETGVLAVLLPGADAMGLLALLALEQAEGLTLDPELRLAALLPDDAKAVGATARRLRLSNALTRRLCDAASPWGEPPTPSGARRAVHALGPQAAADRLRLAWRRAPDPTWRDAWGEVQDWRPPSFPVTGADIKALGVPEGPRVGRLRHALERWWIAAGFPPERERAMAELARLAEAD